MRKRLDDDYDKRNISLIAIPNLPTFSMAIKSPPGSYHILTTISESICLSYEQYKSSSCADVNSLDCLDPIIRDTLCCDHFADIFIVIICVINGDYYCYVTKIFNVTSLIQN